MRFKMLAVPVGLVTLVAAAALPAAPVPKQSRDAEPADLKGLHALIGKTVESGKWPSAEEEKKIKATLQKLLDRITKAGELKERKLPVKFDNLKKADVTKTAEGSVEGAFLIAGDVGGDETAARNSVILASGDVHFTGIENSVVVGKNVRFTGADNNVLVVAREFLRGTGAELTTGECGPVLVAGQWIRLTVARKSVCHVLRPGTRPAPADRGRGPFPAIRMTRGEKTLFLNDPADVRLTASRGNTMLVPKTPIAR